MNSRLQPQRPMPNRFGFTLLELLLALGLTVVLVTVLYRAMEHHWRFSVAGQVEVERAQIARAVFNQMSADIRSVVFQELKIAESTDTEDDSTDAEESAADTTTDTVALEYMEPSEAFGSSSIGLFGDAETLVLHIRRRYDHRQTPDNRSAIMFPEGDMKAVSYFMAFGDENDLQDFASYPDTDIVPEDGINGLARMSGDLFMVQVAGSNGESGQTASRTDLMAPEINYLSIDYHDGFEWMTEWDSDVEGRLPNAIGITIGFREPQYPEGSFIRQSASSSTDTYRQVIPIVSSNPFEGLGY